MVLRGLHTAEVRLVFIGNKYAKFGFREFSPGRREHVVRERVGCSKGMDHGDEINEEWGKRQPILSADGPQEYFG